LLSGSNLFLVWVRSLENVVYRIGFVLVMVLAVTLGVVIGALNPQVVAVDLLWFSLAWPLGLTLICVLLTGLLLGLLLSALFSTWPARLQLRKVQKELRNKTEASTGMLDPTDV
jgi:uncharacterized membrane protein YciS (DUF1049 family)